MDRKKSILFLLIITSLFTRGQIPVDLSRFDKTSAAKASVQNNSLSISWPTGKTEQGKMIINLENEKPLFSSIQLSKKGVFQEIAANLDPVFLLTIGKRDLVSQNGWNIFFDTTNRAPHKTFVVDVRKQSVAVVTTGSRTVIKISEVKAGSFSGALEITLYNGSPLFNVAAAMTTEVDSTAILYDAGLVSTKSLWNKIAWSNTNNELQITVTNRLDTAKNVAVKYRTIIGENKAGSLALFPPPHQYFYPLDEAFNLKFTWYGTNYRSMISAYGIGIRQDPMGDKRWVPWFNAPPKTEQRLNYFCLLSTEGA
ncbi:MAG: hypothetical protein M3342_22925, partial [Bacteroidota bacterium]|nr:hypothetical protein [Bacteroidota bacterium]